MSGPERDEKIIQDDKISRKDISSEEQSKASLSKPEPTEEQDPGTQALSAPPLENNPTNLSPQATPSAPSEEGFLWHVVRVQSGKEDKVKATLESRVDALGMKDKIQQIVVPTELISEIRKDSKRVVKRKLYPGYVMVYMIKTVDTHSLLKSTPGIGDLAGIMSETEVDRMLMSCGHTKDKPKPKVSFRKGQSIKIKEGPFENYEGIVDEVNEHKGNLKVKISIFGRYTQVELGFWQVESV